MLEYWRGALLDRAAAEQVPRQLAAVEWLDRHLPPDADDAPAVCMGDARLVNGIVAEGRVRAPVGFEIVYIGNPAANIAYSLFVDERHRRAGGSPLDGLPGADETWQRWGDVTDRATTHRDYWAAFGAMVICVTATRALVQWAGDDGASFTEQQNPLVDGWEAAIRKAGR